MKIENSWDAHSFEISAVGFFKSNKKESEIQKLLNLSIRFFSAFRPVVYRCFAFSQIV